MLTKTYGYKKVFLPGLWRGHCVSVPQTKQHSALSSNTQQSVLITEERKAAKAHTDSH